ncbi:MAG: hypothetical protein HY763_03930 [Planctomycetes bacterium]|nr:hypothetical protein [Planctomycetota bacterium]
MPDRQPNTALRVPLAGFLAWLVPGMGHLFLGHRARGLVFLVTITATFWTGVAIGGVGGTVHPGERRLWFMAQLLTGGQSLAALGMHNSVVRSLPQDRPPYLGSWLSIDVGVHYTGVAGLLNLLVILDALSRADPASRHHRVGEREPPLGGT